VWPVGSKGTAGQPTRSSSVRMLGNAVLAGVPGFTGNCSSHMATTGAPWSGSLHATRDSRVSHESGDDDKGAHAFLPPRCTPTCPKR
jgi:hypothetical protein